VKLQAAIDDDTARLKASLEKSRTECEAVVMQLDEVKRDLNKLTADKQLVRFPSLSYVYAILYFVCSDDTGLNFILILSIFCFYVVLILIFTVL